MPVLTISMAFLADYDFSSDSTELINFDGLIPKELANVNNVVSVGWRSPRSKRLI